MNKQSERRMRRDEEESAAMKLAAWSARTAAGKLVQSGQVTELEQLYLRGLPVLEPEIIDKLFPEMESKALNFNRTARLRDSGRQLSSQVIVAVGNKNGFVGFGQGKASAVKIAFEKASREAKLNMTRVVRGCGSWECNCATTHSVPFKSSGKSGSVRVTLLPAPRGVGLVAGDTAKEILRLAGIKDVWLQTSGDTRSVGNFAKAVINALESANRKKGTLKTQSERQAFIETTPAGEAVAVESS
ncbi:MAG TPA: 30S ribosomal protein S5 [archaeon]|nr:30S ribosomal protein S5 [archaeon]HLD81026.1 30S ribosomal protein S5 [archaeon]